MRDWTKDLLAVLPAERSYIVAVRCSFEELDLRERDRWEPGSRKIGLGRRQYEQIHADNVYDVEVDTTGRSAAESAEVVADSLAGMTPEAVRSMQAALTP